MLIAIALAIINAIIAIALQSGRLLFAAARDEALPAAHRPAARASVADDEDADRRHRS